MVRSIQTAPSADHSREMVKRWIRSICQEKDWTPTELARKADITPSTILRILNDPNYRYVTTVSTIQKIAEASGTAPPQYIKEAFATEYTDKADVSRRRRRLVAPVDVLPMRGGAIPPGLEQASRPFLDDAEGVIQIATYVPDSRHEPAFFAHDLVYGATIAPIKFGTMVICLSKDGKECDIGMLDQRDGKVALVDPVGNEYAAINPKDFDIFAVAVIRRM